MTTEPVAAEVQGPIEADADGDNDSAFDANSLLSSTTSLGSSILKNRVENGRTYHSYKEGSYAIPNDETENDRLDLQHHLFLLTFNGKLSLFPEDEKKKIQSVLDLGTGTGIWAIDYADEHPEAKVIGVDLSAIQPTFLPPNLAFEIDDIEENWTYTTKFDFIHGRFLTGSIKDWPKLITQCFEYLNPGGYLELVDCILPFSCDDDTLPPTSPLSKWGTLIAEAAQRFGRPLDSALTYESQLKEKGFEDVTLRQDAWPMNQWPKDKKLKEMGMWQRESMLQGLEGFSLGLLTRVMGWSAEEVQAFLVDVRKDVKDPKIHAYWKIYTVHGRKPL